MKKEELEQRLEAFRQELLKEFSKENKFEIGKWYYCEKKGHHYLYYYQGDNKNSYGFFRGDWTQDWGCGLAASWLTRPATDKEVEEALINEAKKRGLFDLHKKSIKFPNGDIFKKGSFLNGGNEYKYSEGFLEWHGLEIFENGKWAEIVDDKIMIGGYDVKKIYHANKERVFYKIGCKEITQTTLENIYLFMTNNELKKVAFDEIETDLETIEKILKL